MRKFDSDAFKKEIVKRFGSIGNLKTYLKYEAEDKGFDVRLSEVLIDGVKVKYSGNENHFAWFFVELPHVGMTGTYALDYDSFTTAGKRRGATHCKTIF